jgi:cell division protein FtsL
MQNAQSFIQAYSQAPWRKQRLYISTFMLILVGVAAVAGVYLYVTAKAASTGRDIQELQWTIKSLEQKNANMEAQVAYLMSADIMKQRAQILDAQPIQPEEVVYLAVSGLNPRQPVKVAVDIKPTPLPGPILTPEYSQSLLDWLAVKLKELQPLYSLAGGGQP